MVNSASKIITFPKDEVFIGIGPNAWRSDEDPDIGKDCSFEQAMSEIALAGYKGCEVNCLFPDDAILAKDKLDLRGLQVASGWFGSYLATKPYEKNEKEFRQTLEYFKILGSDGINVCEQSYSLQKNTDIAIFSEKPKLQAEEWERMVVGLRKFGKLANEYGMLMTFHHHIGTVVCTPEEIDRLLNDVNSELLSLCFDDAHFTFYNIDPVEMAKKYAPRTGHIHLKNIRKSILERVKDEKMHFIDAIHNGTFTIPGDGDTEYEPILQVFSDVGYKGWIIIEADQDPAIAPKEPLYYAIEARKYLREMMGL